MAKLSFITIVFAAVLLLVAPVCGYEIIFMTCEKKDNEPSFHSYSSKNYIEVSTSGKCNERTITGKAAKGPEEYYHEKIGSVYGQGVSDWTSNVVTCPKGGTISIKDDDVVRYQVRSISTQESN